MYFSSVYISSNTNQIPTVVDWGKNNLICYGAKNSVLIYDPLHGSGGKVICTLVGHSKRVNSVKWLCGTQIDYEVELISGSADGSVCVWTFAETGYKPSKLIGHESNVNIVDGLYKGCNKAQALIVSISMDCTANIWLRSNPGDEFEKSQTINFNYNIAIGLQLYIIPNSNEIILGCCLDDSKIYIYKEAEKTAVKFELSVVLLGHEDWVRSLAFKNDGVDILMASCSQDSFIRIWRMTPNKIPSEGPTESSVELKVNTNTTQYYVYVDSVLTGHDSFVYAVHWCPVSMQLLSASFDKTLIIWKYYTDSGMWLEKVRVGEVGGNTLGFYGGMFSPTGKEILAYSYNGAFHMWRESENSNSWVPSVTVGGHFTEVVDCAWEPNGEFLFTASADQTVRIHAPWSDQSREVTWHEIGRPQVHGYNMSSLAVISRYSYASAAEEKVIRVFQAPVNFVQNCRNLCLTAPDKEGDEILTGLETGPKGACVPSLGLSNKAVYSSDNKNGIPIDSKNGYPEESYFSETHMTEPPTEETLLQNTLWPEVHKLYGHGYEVYCLDASPDGKYLASACKSTKLEYAAILLWDTTTWKQVQKLVSHTLTVVQLKFSPDSNHLLSVSRDRRWSLFSKSMENIFELVATIDKKTAVHTRIIWTCSWSHDSLYFATGSRDGKLVVWFKNNGKQPNTVLGKYEVASSPLNLENESVTSVAFAPAFIYNKYLVAVGLDSGLIFLFSWSVTGWNKLLSLSECDAHHLTVKRLAFRPILGEAGSKEIHKNVIQLASCSCDNSVKIHNIYLE